MYLDGGIRSDFRHVKRDHEAARRGAADLAAVEMHLNEVREILVIENFIQLFDFLNIHVA